MLPLTRGCMADEKAKNPEKLTAVDLQPLATIQATLLATNQEPSKVVSSLAARLTRACVGLLICSMLGKSILGFLTAMYVLCMLNAGGRDSVCKVALRAKFFLTVVFVLASFKLGFEVCVGPGFLPEATAYVEKLAGKCATSKYAADINVQRGKGSIVVDFDEELFDFDFDYAVAERRENQDAMHIATTMPLSHPKVKDIDGDEDDEKDLRLARVTEAAESFVSVLDKELKKARDRGEEDRLAQSLFTAAASQLCDYKYSPTQKCYRVATIMEKAMWTAYAMWMLIGMMNLVFAGLALKYAAAIGRAARQTTDYARFEGPVVVATSVPAQGIEA